jgi:hypothetical protein
MGQAAARQVRRVPPPMSAICGSGRHEDSRPPAFKGNFDSPASVRTPLMHAAY